MAEIEMDVDLAPPVNFNESADEDLIDYDIDTTEDHGHDIWSSHQDEQPSSAPEHVHSTEQPVEKDAKASKAEHTDEHFQDMEQDHPQDDVEYDDEEIVAESHHESHISAEMHQDNSSTLETEQSKEAAETDGGENVGSTIVVETEQVVDEIDYEDGDVTAAQESPNKADEEEGHVPPADPSDEVVTAEPASLPSTKLPAGDTGAPESTAKDDEDEITWEHEDDHEGEDDTARHDDTEAAAGDGVETAAAESNIPPKSEAAYDHTETEPTQNSDSHEQAYEQHTTATDSEYDDTAMEASEEKTSAAYQQDESLSQQDEQDSELHDFPAITVQYKGEEFPFFSQDDTEGFFSELSVLDHSMKSVLAGFRAELENEVSEQDELVFQVDELGLEFTEVCDMPSSVHEDAVKLTTLQTTVQNAQNSLATITLRQVLEVFDLLVKNQDPDRSRTLYSYLFTKANASKRFEFLAESAAAGRGLDDVIYLFESPHHADAEHGHGHEHGHDDDHDEDSEANDVTETHESAEDDDENDNADVESEESEASEEDEEEEEEETSVVEEQPLDTMDRYEEEEQEDEDEEEEEEEDEDEDFMGETEDFIGDVEDNANQDGEYSDGADEGYKDEQLQAVVVEPASHSGQGDASAEAENAPDATYSYGKATNMHRVFGLSCTNRLRLDDEDDDEDANPFVQLEIHESMADDGGEVEYEEIVRVEGGDEESRQIAMHSIDEYIDTNEPDTGTTNTLADNREAISTLLDMSVEQGLDEEITNEDLAFEDEMPEIDWRDDLPTTPSGASKRRRAEDEPEAEDEQGEQFDAHHLPEQRANYSADVKRRRP